MSTLYQQQIKKKQMTNIVFIFPDKPEKSGGYTIQDMIVPLFSTQATKIQKNDCAQFIKDNQTKKNQYLIIIFWGKHVDDLVTQFKGWRLVYYAHSVGYTFKNFHSHIPIICVSNSTMGYWGRQNTNPLYLLHNPIADRTPEIQIPYRSSSKNIDIFIMNRKTSDYVKQLVEFIRQNHINVNIMQIDHWIDDHSEILQYMQNAKVFLYDSRDYWQKRSLREGFGVPPMEAIQRKCIVFTSLNDSLSDYLEPHVNCFQFTRNAHIDIQQILKAITSYDTIISQLTLTFDPKYTKQHFISRARIIIDAIIQYYNSKAQSIPIRLPEIQSTKHKQKVNTTTKPITQKKVTKKIK